MSHDESADTPGADERPAEAKSDEAATDDSASERDADFAPADSKPDSGKVPYWKRRQQKIRDEIERNRRGDYKVPTWVLVVILVAVIAGWAALIFLS